jgi:aryl-alcohol dehydrogenase-like predicted oxidoreductase
MLSHMEFTQIGSKTVSRIGLGTWAIGGLDWGTVPDADAVATILDALDRGINLIDTAPIYGRGRAEELIGRAMHEHGRRDAFYIATKCGLNWEIPGQPGVFADSSTARLRRELEDSLRRLGTEYIDLYQVHWPDLLIPVEETAGLLAEFQREGKVLAIGVSNFSAAQMEAFRSVAPLASNQPPYNLFEREIDAETLPWCARNQVSVLSYSSLCRSLLGGRLRRGMIFPEGDIRAADPKFQEPRLSQYLNAVDRLSGLAQERFGKSVVEMAVRWVLDRPGVSVALWGAKRPEQMAAIPGVVGWRLDETAMAEIDRIVAEAVTSPVGPEYLTPQVRSVGVAALTASS